MVRKKLTAREGRGWLSGTLFCTHFRVAFVPQDSPKPDVSPCGQLQWFKTNSFELIHCYLFFFHMSSFETMFVMQDNADPVLLGDHDVALASIEKVVVGK